MADLNVRSDAVDVEQIMEQIRARIREKRGADYTEAELQQLATTNLKKFMDPKGVRSDLVEQFRKGHKPAEWPNYQFGEDTLYETHRGFVRMMRKLLRPILKLLFNPDPIVAALHVQSQLNTELLRQQERESLRYELVHNLVVELTRASIEVQNLKMRVESLSSRLDFDERRARALEHVVQYRQERKRPEGHSTPPAQGGEPGGAPAAAGPGAGPGASLTEGGDQEGGERRRRRRRRRRRPGSTLAESGSSSSGGNTGGSSGADDSADGPDNSDSSDGPDSNDSPDSHDAGSESPDADRRGNTGGGSDDGAPDQ